MRNLLSSQDYKTEPSSSWTQTSTFNDTSDGFGQFDTNSASACHAGKPVVRVDSGDDFSSGSQGYMECREPEFVVDVDDNAIPTSYEVCTQDFWCEFSHMHVQCAP